MKKKEICPNGKLSEMTSNMGKGENVYNQHYNKRFSPKRQVLDSSKLREFAGDNFRID